jgi:hypothetical protein
MSFQIDTTSLVLLLVIAAIAIGIAAYVASIKLKARREQRNIAVITATIVEYFRKTGVQVAAGCTRLPGSDCYTAVIESEPMKRFRLSHIIEMTVRDHVRKACGLELQKIYWRFPIKEGAQGAADLAEGDKKEGDEYINEGLEHYRHIPKVEATELPWEHFEQVASNESDKKTSGQE